MCWDPCNARMDPFWPDLLELIRVRGIHRITMALSRSSFGEVSAPRPINNTTGTEVCYPVKYSTSLFMWPTSLFDHLEGARNTKNVLPGGSINKSDGGEGEGVKRREGEGVCSSMDV